MKLKCEDTLACSFWVIICNVHSGDTIDLVNQTIAHCDDAVFVPLAGIPFLIFVAKFLDDSFFTLIINGNLLETLSHYSTSLSLVVHHSKEVVRINYICLITIDGEALRVGNFTSVLETRVISFDASLESNFKVSHFAVPNEESTASGMFLS